jgi:hypothetical protein
MTPTRRETLGALGVVAALAGCAGSPGADATTTADDTTTSPSENATTDGGADLDLREANVTAVTVEETADGHRFDVTLYHDDGGEDGYANWWQVETLDGTRLGRRELLHAHGTQEFTRSTTVDIDEPCVVVRGHDQTHGYGGRAMLVNAATGATRAADQGSDPREFSGESCP